MSITIYAKDLVKKYGSRTVVNHVSFNVKQGEIVGLLGPNGAGKTTSFYQVVGLVRPDEGTVFINDQNITALPMYKRAQLGIGYLPQEASVFRKLSVEDNIAAVLEMTKLSKQEQREKLESLLDEFRLHHVRKSNGDVLSGGERRRTEIARALAVDPKFILLDEPFAGIDPIAVEDIQTIVAKLKYKNIGILITDHNVTETLSICDRAYLLIDGKIFRHGTADELATDEQVKKLYLGRDFVLRRKDWLHEEARSEKKITLESLIHSVESAINWSEKIDENAAVRDNFIRNIRGNASDDLGLDDYGKFLIELQESLVTYAKQNNNEDLLSRAEQLLHAENDNHLVSSLNTILLYLKSEKN
jgi:lipopolysaccharide export system ATP-binding protein